MSGLEDLLTDPNPYVKFLKYSFVLHAPHTWCHSMPTHQMVTTVQPSDFSANIGLDDIEKTKT